MEKDKSVRFKLPLDSVISNIISIQQKVLIRIYIATDHYTMFRCNSEISAQIKKRQFHVFKNLYSNGKCLI